MFEKLIEVGFQIKTVSHAEAILSVDFPQAAPELEEILLGSKMPIEEIIGSGGGETKGTQRLRRALVDAGWRKHKFIVQRIIDGRSLESRTHEIDHIKTFDNGTIAVEIEWNNKDPFFDRDLENFKRLHADGAISLGVVITRGAGLQTSLPDLVARFAERNSLTDFDAVRAAGLNPTRRQVADVMKRVQRSRNPVSFAAAWVDHFVSDKFGTATTHWSKLEARIARGVGNPCPLVLIGLPASFVTFDEPQKVIEALIAEGAANDDE